MDIQAEMLVGWGFIISLWSMEHAEEPSWIAVLGVLLHLGKLRALQLRKVFLLHLPCSGEQVQNINKLQKVGIARL